MKWPWTKEPAVVETEPPRDLAWADRGFAVANLAYLEAAFKVQLHKRQHPSLSPFMFKGAFYAKVNGMLADPTLNALEADAAQKLKIRNRWLEIRAPLAMAARDQQLGREN